MDSVEGDPRSEDPINSRFPQPYVVLRIFNRQNPCYHCPFLYDDARDAIGRHPRFPGTLPPRPTKSVAQALLPVRLCQVDDSTDGVCRPIGSPRFSNRECAIRIQRKS